jgi:NAD(P)-dependent dehydrogenase (short-subunit alcohol dehydrogenase family)
MALTFQHAAEGSPDRIRVNSISPGPTDTPALREVIGDGGLPAPIPLGRLGAPADIVNAAIFLAGDESGWITGANLMVDGGMSIIDGAEPIIVSAS